MAGGEGCLARGGAELELSLRKFPVLLDFLFGVAGMAGVV